MPFKTYYQKLSIRSKLLLVFYIQVVLPMLLIGLFFYVKINTVMEAHAISLTMDTLKIIRMRTEDFMKNVKVVSQDMLYDQEIYDVLNSGQSDKFQYYNHVNSLKNILRKRALAFDSIQSITIVTKKNQFFSYDSNSGRANIEAIIPYASLLPLAREAKGGAVWFVDEDGDKRNVFLARIINDLYTYKEIGLMAILIDEKELSKTYDQMSSDILKELAILTPNNNIVFSEKVDMSWMNAENLLFAEKMGYIRGKGNDRIISYIKMDTVDWYIITSFSKDALLKEFNDVSNWVIKVFIPIVLILSALTIFLAMDIVNPIHQLVGHIKAFRSGEVEPKLNLKRKDELGYLADQLDLMIYETNHLMSTVINEQILRREVQIKALQAQINPHFLFNTLETINWRAQLINAPEISEMVTALSGMLEANISRDIKLITLKEELGYVKNYLVIMMRRYEDRLEIKWELEHNALSLKIPQLLLQPIIENAIKHGVSEIQHKGVILVRVFTNENLIIVEVVDNGKGLVASEVTRLNQRFDMSLNRVTMIQEESRQSIGLDNVNQRIKLHFGEIYGIHVNSRLGYYTKLTLKLPNERM
ncbi:sensor histidine kinase [Fusibacter sp. 3D3]|uniref:cache domain-containing sensor histidine kinase n=1 Tax=Fusibacter sp. 3D3 TaxID=1048380 RepID=UPI000853DEB7|nr:histidine kinase [Fusibacter sp. 3D3]GAU77305.1 sensor histidine kinase [Fusibacter sp. 3D3]